MSTDMETIVGLVKGRHEMPVSEYIWNEVPDVLDFEAMDKHVCSWLECNVGVSVCAGIALNSAGEDTFVFTGKRELVVYVTGLTPCTASVIKMCGLNGITLTLMHYDRDTGVYSPQRIF